MRVTAHQRDAISENEAQPMETRAQVQTTVDDPTATRENDKLLTQLNVNFFYYG